MPCKQCRIIITATILVLAVLVFWSYQNNNIEDVNDVQDQITVAGDILNIDIVTTITDMTRGLGGKENLSDDYGMLFVYSDSRTRTFWMKDMLVDIDIIWIQEDTIIGFADNVSAEPGVSLGDLKTYSSPVPVDKVLEVRAGLRADNNWDIGTKIDL